MGPKLFGNMSVSASGLRGMRARMDVIAENIANVETTRTPEGEPYRRKTVVLKQAAPGEPVPVARPPRMESFSGLLRTHRAHMDIAMDPEFVEMPAGSELEIDFAEDPQPFKLVHNPAHPDADEDGYVLQPNIDVVREFVDLIAAQRAYDANINAIESAKDMFLKALEI